ncbi:tripartite tricarboxylate transporter permease [Starkeya sp. ORNL1]|jgi:TctA family transporter|uniref:tripartite tricarboxylate transporter permease n=1 Tax=Starkeya sp. ORNL1 TaxID=2709380 RepID=UPI00146341B3|nr:tripartite tricarboxylate transporter permease [Starkeya sp. ORNL1]QJP14586.1 tripartite tricarboxylate transporter permease [Starkeya sp. ORNL1]
MDIFSNLALGFEVALSPERLLYCFVGVLLGTFIGVLPGVGPLVTISVLLPITYNLDPSSSLIMLAGIYYGAQYGGSTTAILVNLPGESSSVVTCLDGYQMARQGRAGPALAIAAIGSFIAGTASNLVVAAFAPALGAWALTFGSPEYFSIMVLGLLTAAVLAHGSILKSISMIVLGLLLGLSGTDVTSGTYRFTFGIAELSDGLDFVVIAMGVFGLADIIANIQRPETREIFSAKISNLMPSRADLKASAAPIARGTLLGSVLGILPGTGTTISSFLSYALEKKVSRHPERFGKGAIEGVAGPESANNAAAQTAFIPTLTLGIPHNGTMALMLGALTMFGISPGPQVMTSHPDLFWGLVASMWIGNLMLVILNLPLLGIWVKMLAVPYRLLYPAIVILSCIGVYTLNNSSVSILLLAVFGLVGLILVKLDFEPAPLLLGFILGPMMEENLRRSMVLSKGDPTIFLTRPLSLTVLLISAALLGSMLIPMIRHKKEEAIASDA